MNEVFLLAAITFSISSRYLNFKILLIGTSNRFNPKSSISFHFKAFMRLKDINYSVSSSSNLRISPGSCNAAKDRTITLSD